MFGAKPDGEGHCPRLADYYYARVCRFDRVHGPRIVIGRDADDHEGIRAKRNGRGADACCFFWSYTFMQIPSGLLVDRYSTKRVLAAGYALWSLSCVVIGLGSSF